MQQWVVNYWETYSPVVNWRSVRSLLALEILHEFPIRSIEFLLAFPQAYVDVDVLMYIPLVMLVDVNIGE